MISGRVPVDHFAAGVGECECRTPEDAATTEIAVRNAVETIGALMREDRRRRARDGLPDLVLADEMAAQIAPKRRASRRTPGTAGRLRGGWPRPAHLAWAAGFGAVLIWPGAVLAAMFAGFVICLVGVALFGPDIFGRLRDAALGASCSQRRRRARRTDRPEIFEEPLDGHERLRDLRG
jgi:hypothetical protein